MPPGLTRTPLATMDQTRKQARIEFAGDPGPPDRGGGRGRPGSVSHARPRRRRSGRRAGRRGPALSRHGGRLRQDPDPVRPAHRIVPGHQAQVRRHAPRGGVGEVGRLLRRLGRRRGLRGAPGRGQPGQVVLLRGLLPRRRGEHPDPRRDRVHLGARRPPLLQAGQVVASCFLGDPSYHRELLAQRIGI